MGQGRWGEGTGGRGSAGFPPVAQHKPLHGLVCHPNQHNPSCLARSCAGAGLLTCMHTRAHSPASKSNPLRVITMSEASASQNIALHDTPFFPAAPTNKKKSAGSSGNEAPAAPAEPVAQHSRKKPESGAQSSRRKAEAKPAVASAAAPGAPAAAQPGEHALCGLAAAAPGWVPWT